MKPKPVVMLRCCCCKAQYERGRFRCCAPPGGMASHNWLALACPMPRKNAEGEAVGGCGKCAKHCQCPNKVERMGKGPLAGIAAEWMARNAHRQIGAA